MSSPRTDDLRLIPCQGRLEFAAAILGLQLLACRQLSRGNQADGADRHRTGPRKTRGRRIRSTRQPKRLPSRCVIENRRSVARGRKRKPNIHSLLVTRPAVRRERQVHLRGRCRPGSSGRSGRPVERAAINVLGFFGTGGELEFAVRIHRWFRTAIRGRFYRRAGRGTLGRWGHACLSLRHNQRYEK